MTDTIDLLQTIGSNAALRHASAEELVSMLEEAKASAALMAAAASGDRAMLATEFGNTTNQVTESIQCPAHEEEEREEDEEESEKPAPEDARR